jgi:hypothetical protein
MYDAPDIVSMSFKFLAGFIARVPASPPPALSRIATSHAALSLTLCCRLLLSMPSHHDSPRDVFIRIREWSKVASNVSVLRDGGLNFEESARYAIPTPIRKNNLAPCSLRLIGSGPLLNFSLQSGAIRSQYFSYTHLS